MSLINLPVPALHNGVSQQSPVVRATDQGELQVNGWSSLADGLSKRAPSALVTKLMGSTSGKALIWTINRDLTERYIVVADGGVLRVFDLNGVEQTVHAPNGWGYISSATDPEKDLAMVTVADYTFVVNKKVSPAMTVVSDPANPPEATPPPTYYVQPREAQWGGQNYNLP